MTARDVAEPVVSFDNHDDAQAVKDFLKERGYDFVAVRVHGHIAGYAVLDRIGSGRLDDCRKNFEPGRLISDRTSLLQVITRMRTVNPLFVSVHDKVWGIVTKGDLQKFPVRMWLFGVLSLVEMQMLRLIRQQFPGDEWRQSLKSVRLKMADTLFKQRKERNEQIDLDDCLQWCDKVFIIARCERLRQILGFRSITETERRLKRMENLRDSLAHAQDLLTNNWPRLIDVIEDAERVLDTAERVPARVTSG